MACVAVFCQCLANWADSCMLPVMWEKRNWYCAEAAWFYDG